MQKKNSLKPLISFFGIFLSAILIIGMILPYLSTSVVQAGSVDHDSVSQKINAVAKTRLEAFNVRGPTVGTSGGDWTIMALARSNMGSSALYDQYYQAVASVMQDKGGILDKNKYSEYSRVILGLTSAGKDITNVGGYDLLAYMTDFSKIKKQGLNGPIWALIALDSHDYQIPQNTEVTEDNENSRVRMIEYILERQKEDGGWNLSDSETVSDPDMTGMAITALHRYTQKDTAKGINDQLAQNVSQAIAAGMNCLSAMQNDEGDFTSYGASNLESTVWAWMAMCCMKIDPFTDTRFIKNGMTVIDAIEKYYIEDPDYGCGFQHVMDGGWNDIATDQAHYGLVAYQRFEEGASFFFDMNNVEISGEDPSDPTEEKEKDPTEQKEQDPEEHKEQDSSEQGKTDPSAKEEDDPLKPMEENPSKSGEEDPGKQSDTDVKKQQNTDKGGQPDANRLSQSAAVAMITKKTGGSDGLPKSEKTLLEMSGLTLGESDIKMVDITGTGGLRTSLGTVDNKAAIVFSKLKNGVLPFGLGCLVMGFIWIISVCVSKKSKNGNAKRVREHIKKRNKENKGSTD